MGWYRGRSIQTQIVLRQYRNQHLAPFRGQEIVGAAGRAVVHDFEADAGFHERAGEGRVGEAQLGAGAEQDDFGLLPAQPLEMMEFQGLEADGAKDFPFQQGGAERQAEIEALAVDQHMVVAVAGKLKKAVRAAQMKFHKLFPFAGPVRLK